MSPEVASGSTRHEQISRHYDAGNEFYELWLDESMSYSCALWDDSDDLASAQRRKLDFFLEPLSATVADGRLLDVGCGWGGALRRAIATTAFTSAVGLTLSEEQAAYVRQHDQRGITVATTPWEQHEPSAPYDAILSIGAFEHFAPATSAAPERVERYAAFFESAWSWLAPGGRLGLQSIVNDGAPDEKPQIETAVGSYLVGQVFGDSALPRLPEVLVASDRWFQPVAIRIDPRDYARTCRAWRQQLREADGAAREVAGDDVVDAYIRYLGVAQTTFQLGWCSLIRIVFDRRPRPLVVPGA